MEVRLADKEEQSLERDLVYQQVCRLTDRVSAKVDAGKDDTLLLAKKVWNVVQLCLKSQSVIELKWNSLYSAVCIFLVTQFLPRDALVHSAVLRLHVVRLSVCPSVCLSVTLVDQDHIGWKSWKLIVRTLSPAPSLFVAERPST